MQKVAIFGAAGAIGHAVCAELERRGVPFRAVGRTRQKLEEAFGHMRHAENFAADLSEIRSAADAARGVDTLIYTVGVPYTAFHLHPELMRITVEAGAMVKVERLAVVSSVYSYGAPQTPKVAETHPRIPQTRKGMMRKEQEDIALEAQKKGLLQSLVVRLPDFYGPHAELSLANPILRAAVQGKKANWIGPLDLPHEFIYVPDAGPVLVELASSNEFYGEAWNLGGAGEITGRQFITKAYRAAGREPKWRTVGKGILTVAGWFNPFMKEVAEIYYLAETPVILDDSKLRAKLGSVRKTPYEEGIRETLAWMKK